MEDFASIVSLIEAVSGLQFGCLLKNELMLSRKDVLLNWELNTTASATVAVRIELYPYWKSRISFSSGFSPLFVLGPSLF